MAFSRPMAFTIQHGIVRILLCGCRGTGAKTEKTRELYVTISLMKVMMLISINQIFQKYFDDDDALP